ncbi:histidine phosphatase family protein [Dokdonella sp.]|uniref:histidine phosphatase family protein n=1 Tax=Dokdonella sp. TaxID=2291710 RepID=UPI0031C175CC|nr:histidine phosphatase family protein [Dokdonella sp.]
MKHLFAALCMLLLTAPALAAEAQGKAPDPANAPAVRTLVLVRHGLYERDPQADERLGPHLAPIGVAQAQLAGARLAGMPGHFDALWSSPVQRARDTAAVIAADFPGRRFEIVDDLAECTPPTRREDVMQRKTAEGLARCKAQLDRAFDRFFKPASGTPRTEMLVCHGNVIRYLVSRALGVDTMSWLEMSVRHASITTIRIEADGRFKVIAVGDSGHIPPNMQSGATGDPRRSLAIPPLPLVRDTQPAGT